MVKTEQVMFAPGVMGGIRQHAVKEHRKGGYEAVGFLAKPRGSELITVTMPLNNHSSNPTQGFFVEPWEQFRAERTLAERNYEIVGVYHSHPISEARPSLTDHTMARPGELMVIYSVVFDETTVWAEHDGALHPVEWSDA